MNQGKIGKFILELRKEANLTQEQLAEKILIGREAVSKWERGVTIPDVNSLQELSKIFDVSINELLSGERINKNNKNEINKLTLNLYSKNIKNRKWIIFLGLLLCLIIILFLVYYFISSYRSIKVYNVSGSGERIDVFNGMFIDTKEKIYFSLGDIDLKEEKYNIESLELFYLQGNDKKLILSSPDDDMLSFVDYHGYDSYLETDNIKYILKNMYLYIKYDDGWEEKIKLNIRQDYINDSLFFKKDEKIGNKVNVDNDIDEKYLNIISKMKDVFVDQGDNNYTYQKIENGVELTVLYLEDSDFLRLEINNDKETEVWTFMFDFENFDYEKSVGDKKVISFYINKNNELNCSIGTCDNYLEISEKLWQILDGILNGA